MSSTVRTPPPTVSGMKQASAVRRTTSSMMSRFSWLAVMSRKRELVGAGGVIGDRRFDRVAGVAQIEEPDALDDTAVLDVEAGNDADLEHRRPRSSRLGAPQAPDQQDRGETQPDEETHGAEGNGHEREPAEHAEEVKHTTEIDTEQRASMDVAFIELAAECGRDQARP